MPPLLLLAVRLFLAAAAAVRALGLRGLFIFLFNFKVDFYFRFAGAQQCGGQLDSFDSATRKINAIANGKTRHIHSLGLNLTAPWTARTQTQTEALYNCMHL